MAEMVTGKTIKMPCMRRGLVKYPDETILVTQNSLEQLATTAFGIPVVIEHPGIAIDSESLKDIKVVGRVAKFEYDMAQDLWFAEFVVDDDEAVSLLKQGWGVSTAWYGDDYGNGGTYNNLDYDRELIKGRYEHLAIVKNPRYEMAVDPIFMNSKSANTRQTPAKASSIIVNSSSNSTGGIRMFAKIWRTVKEEVKANENEELVLELEHGHVPLSKLVEELKSYKAKEQEAEAKKAEAESKKGERVLNDDDEVEVDGKKMKVADLKAEYSSLKAKHGEDKKEAEAEDKKEAAADEAKECDDDMSMDAGKDEDVKEHEAMCDEAEDKPEPKKAEAKKSEAKKAENARFNSLKSAYENGVGFQVEDNFVSTRERVEMGRSRYGSSK